MAERLNRGSPFDQFKGKTFEGLDPKKFNKDFYQNQQKQLFADTFKDQLGQLGSTWEKETGSSRDNKGKLDAATTTLNDLNGKTGGLERSFKESESTYKKAESKVKSEQNMLNSYQNSLNSAKNQQNASQNVVRNQQAKMNSISDQLRKNLTHQFRGHREPQKSRLINDNLNRQLANHKDYQSAAKSRNTAQNNVNSYANKASTYQNRVNEQTRDVERATSSFNQATQNFNKANTQLTQHKNQVSEYSKQVNNFSKAMGTANATSEKAMKDAEGIQQKITDYQTRSEPLKALEGKIQGGYGDAVKQSTEELKKIAANNLDPVSQKNAQNLLNQRAEQVAKTFGKNVEDVKKEMMTGQQFTPEQFKSEDFNSFMGIEAQKQAELQEEGALNNLDAQGNPTTTTQNTAQPPVAPEQVQSAPPPAPAPMPQQQVATPQAPVTPPAPAANTPQTSLAISQAQPAGNAPLQGTPPQPPAAPVAPAVMPQQQLQAQQQQAQQQFTGQPAQPKPPASFAAPATPQGQAGQQQQTGMPKPPQAQPFGSLNAPIKQGIQQQIKAGFQNAMKIQATPTQAAPKSQAAADPMAERRKAVAAQAMGIASKPTAMVRTLENDKAYGKGQNVNMSQTQSTVNKGVGKRQIR